MTLIGRSPDLKVKVTVPCPAPANVRWWLTSRLKEQGTDKTTNLYPLQDVSNGQTVPRGSSSKSVDSRRCWAIMQVPLAAQDQMLYKANASSSSNYFIMHQDEPLGAEHISDCVYEK
ncbi:hypothetical protein AB0B31_04405 [Catellatospora citrea]|uniref:hypothetical protein n=1 Tax=Catellatospora citrea TaxID=53366 RepID=UPI0033FDBC8B